MYGSDFNLYLESQSLLREKYTNVYIHYILHRTYISSELPWCSDGKDPACNALDPGSVLTIYHI